MPRREKFSEKSLRTLSSRNLTCKGVESEVDAPKRRGFQDGVDLRLDAIKQLIEGRGERERGTNRKVPTQINTKKIEKEGTYA